jgi:hypothetical protein
VRLEVIGVNPCISKYKVDIFGWRGQERQDAQGKSELEFAI